MKAPVVALTLGLAVLAFPPSSKADVDFNLYLGVPHFGFQIGPDYRYRRGYGWYRPGWDGRFSCGEARRIVRASGYRNVSARDCRGRNYGFAATNANGRRVLLAVDSRTGRIWRQ